MKQINLLSALLIITSLLLTTASNAQDEATGLAGDNFSLDGALELFQKAKDLADFEKSLNKNNNKVNNLDLNEDGDVDYIKVIDNIEGNAHAIVLQVALNEKESQDVAVIEIEKNGNSSATLQIVGDEDIYGEAMIMEPFSEEADAADSKGGPDGNYDVFRIVVNVWAWPSVQVVYAPSYRRYVSPWRWAYYPSWWNAWRPLAWVSWRPVRHYHPSRYRITTTHRVVRAHGIYRPVRVRSVTVKIKDNKSFKNEW